MPNPRFFLVACASALLFVSAAHAVGVFFPLPPCRLADTRVAAQAPLAAGETRTFDVVGASLDLSGQGGSPTGCGVPGFDGSTPQVQAIAVNVTVVGGVAEGHLRVFAGGTPLPFASTINFGAVRANPPGGLAPLANGVIVPLRQDSAGDDLAVFASLQTHVVLDVTGFFTDVHLVDGSGSGLDADLLDGFSSTAFGRLAAANTWAATNSFPGLAVGGAAPLVLEGATADNFETTLAVANPTADRTVTLPNASGEISVLGQTIEGGEQADVERSFSVPLGSFRSCDAALVLDSIDGTDGFADFVSENFDQMFIRWDAVAGSPDEGFAVCSTFSVPVDFKSSASVILRLNDGTHVNQVEQMTVEARAHTGVPFLEAAQPITVPGPATLVFPFTNTNPPLNLSFNLRLAVDSPGAGVIDNSVRLAGVEIHYLAEQ